MRLLAAIIASMLLAGCFEWRYEMGLDDAHYQVSPWWNDPGLYHRLPEDGQWAGFDVVRVEWHMTAAVEVVHSPGSDPPPVVLPFDHAEIEKAWGEPADLRLVRWVERAADGGARIWLQLDPESITAWRAEGHNGGLEPPLLAFISRVTGLNGTESRDFAHELLSTGRPRALHVGPGGSPAAGTLHGLPYLGPTRAAALLDDLGGLPAFTTRPEGQPTGLLPHNGQVTLVQNEWEFFLDTVAKRVWRGDLADTDLFWVTPDDSVAYVHWGARKHSNRQASAALADAAVDLGFAVPKMSGWHFTREDVSGGPGD